MSLDTIHQTNSQRYARVRAGFALQNTSLHAWCKDQQVDPHNARKALIGNWIGPKAAELVDQILNASGAENLR